MLGPLASQGSVFGPCIKAVLRHQLVQGSMALYLMKAFLSFPCSSLHFMILKITTGEDMLRILDLSRAQAWAFTWKLHLHFYRLQNIHLCTWPVRQARLRLYTITWPLFSFHLLCRFSRVICRIWLVKACSGIWHSLVYSYWPSHGSSISSLVNCPRCCNITIGRMVGTWSFHLSLFWNTSRSSTYCNVLEEIIFGPWPSHGSSISISVHWRM